MRWLPLLLMVGCGPGDDSDDGVQVAPSFPPAQPDPWVTGGQQGDLTLIRQEATVTSGRTLRVSAIFGSSLGDLRWPAACVFGDRVCVPRDTPVGTIVDTDALDLAPAEAEYAWLGDTLDLGDVSATFDVKRDGVTAGYAGREFAEGILFPSYPLSFSGGEWGDFQGEDIAPLPEDIDILEPRPDLPVELGTDTLASFRWIPTGVGQMVLTLRGDTWSEARLIEDDGQAFVDTSEYRFTRPIDVRLSRVVDAGSVEVGGNTLAVHSIAEQGWCMYDVCDQPLQGEPGALVFDFCWSLTSCGESRWILDPDGTWRTDEGYTGTWEYDCCSETLDIFFSSGTHYFAERQEDGCFVGEMVSWSGNLGDWRGCL